MRPLFSNRPPRRQDSGYALLMLIFFCALLVIAALSLSLRPLTEGQRQKEEEMIWRGKQYARGIKLYYRKTGRYPQSLDDLTKPSLGTLHFMRKAYTDPMNPDGSWRLIYVGPAGQLIGSNAPPAQNPLFTGGGQNAAAGQNPPFGQSLGASGNNATSASLAGAGPLNSFGGGQSAQAGTLSAANIPGTASGPGGNTGAAQQGETQAVGCGKQDSSSGQSSQPTMIGGSIIGVGSKIDRLSVKVFNKQKDYCKWEFIWDPTKDMQVVGQPPAQVGTPIGAPPANPGMPPPTPGGTQPPPPQNPQF